MRGPARADDPAVRMAAAATLWAAEGDPAEVVPLPDDLLDTHRQREGADVLARIGPPAARALPRLRSMLTADCEWTRAHAASALWGIGGLAEAPVVVRTLLAAWEENDATSTSHWPASTGWARPRVRSCPTSVRS
ncbi:hypothetical protein [Actinacidiphila glaucinigra]|uniref:hypothetical protein n=1 Tax=Actinacidiphila glaucinigra TaxID=235986 RepID=UPI0035E36BBB